jgi:hypothetical protein
MHHDPLIEAVGQGSGVDGFLMTPRRSTAPLFAIAG